MLKYLGRRIVALIPVALGVATLTFALIHLVPGDPVLAMLGDFAAPADVVQMRHELKLDLPLWQQYLYFLSGIVRGDLGESNLGAMGFAILGISVPHLYLGPLLMIVFSLDLGWFPLTGRGGLSHLVLPAVTLGTALAAIIARMLRQSLVQVLETDYMRTARSKGLSRAAAVLHHGLRNALTPVVTLLGLQAGALLTGSIVVEMIFSWPGLGRLMITAINSRDYPLVEGCVLVFALSYVVVNMLTDFVYSVVDPRIRLGS